MLAMFKTTFVPGCTLLLLVAYSAVCFWMFVPMPPLSILLLCDSCSLCLCASRLHTLVRTERVLHCQDIVFSCTCSQAVSLNLLLDYARNHCHMQASAREK